MAEVKQKRTAAQKRARKAANAERRRKCEWILMNGKQVRIKRPANVDGIALDQFFEEYGDPIWLHQHELWELIPLEDAIFAPEPSAESAATEDEGGLPF